MPVDFQPDSAIDFVPDEEAQENKGTLPLRSAATELFAGSLTDPFQPLAAPYSEYQPRVTPIAGIPTEEELEIANQLKYGEQFVESDFEPPAMLRPSQPMSLWQRMRTRGPLRQFLGPTQIEREAQLESAKPPPSPAEMLHKVVEATTLPKPLQEAAITMGGAVGEQIGGKTGKGVGEGVAGLIASTPVALPGSRAVSAGFTLDMLSQLPELKEELDIAVAEGDRGRAARAAVALIGTPGMATLAASHALRPSPEALARMPLTSKELAQEQARLAGIPSQEPLPRVTEPTAELKPGDVLPEPARPAETFETPETATQREAREAYEQQAREEARFRRQLAGEVVKPQETLPQVIKRIGRDKVNELLDQWEGGATLSANGKTVVNYPDPRNPSTKQRIPHKDFLSWLARTEAATETKPTAQPELTGKPVSETVSKPSAAETITGREERTGSEMPAEREKRPRRTASTTERPHDLIDELEGSVGKIDPALIREADPNWKPIGAARKLFRRGGIAADKALNDITYDGPKLGLAQDTPLDAFGDAINAAASGRKQFRGAERRNEQQIIREGKQGEQFRKRVLQGERPKAQAENVEQVPVEGLVEGDTFKVQDHEFTVRKLEFDEDLNLVGITVKDGPKFGVQTIRPGQEVIHIDKGTFEPVPREEWPTADKPESIAEQQSTEFPPTEPPRLRQMEKQGDLLSTQREPFALTGEKGIDAERLQREREAVERKRLAGEQGTATLPLESATPATPVTSAPPAISFPGIGSLREKQATAMELGKIRKAEPELWKAITQMFKSDKPAQIAKLAKQRMEEQKIPPPDVEQRAMLAGSHIAGIPDPISLAFAVTFGTKTGREMVGNVARFYSEPLAERIATEGGPQSKAFGGMARDIAQRAKELYGSLTDVLDPALKALGKINRTTTWLNDIAPTTKRWGFRNAQQAVEGPIGNVPPEHVATVNLLKDANLSIGQLAQSVVRGFLATGKYQRAPTAFLVDTIRSGKGPAFDLLKTALAAENKMLPSKVRDILLRIKAEFDAPGSQQTIHRIAQEFERHFPKFPTDLKISTPVGDVWMPILHAKPFEYLQNAATQTAQRTAFLEKVPQQNLQAWREAVVAELKSPEAFDDLVRALHGLPVNEPLRFFSPGTLQGMIAAGANRVLTDVFGSLKLTASAISNLPETVLGNTPAFFGWRNFVRGAVELKQRYAALENLGAINRNIYNFSFDPKAPIRSVLNDFRLGVRKVTMQQFFNEMQEMLAASTAQVFAEKASGRLLSPREQGLFTETAVAMGFERPAAKAMAEGRGTAEQYGRFTRRAAAFATGGNIQPAELSRFGGNRVLTSLFRFQSYPVMKLNAFRKAYMNFAEAVESKDSRRIKASSEQMAKFLFNTTAQGAGATFLAALLTGRGGGVQQTAEDAEENPGKFIFDSTMAGLGGPFTAINYALSEPKKGGILNPQNLNAGVTFPGSIYLELKQLFNLEGPYEGMTMPQALEAYGKKRVPAGKIINHALEEAGLVSSAESVSSTLYRLHDKFLQNHPDPGVKADYERGKGKEFGIGQYRAVRMALRARDADALKKAVAALQAENVKLSDIRKELQPRVESGEQKILFGPSRKLERQFRASLTPAQRKLYDAALKERQDQWSWFRRFY